MGGIRDVNTSLSKVTGSGPLFKALLRISGEDGRNAVILTRQRAEARKENR